MRSKSYILIRLICLFASHAVWGQTVDEFDLDYPDLMCVKEDIVPDLTVDNRKFGFEPFLNGTFKIDWGDGLTETMTTAKMSHKYMAFGKHQFSLIYTDGALVLSRTYEVELRLWSLSSLRLVSASNCVGSEVQFEVGGYTGKTPETYYEMWLGNQFIDKWDLQQVIDDNGHIGHVFPDELCNARITLKAFDDCVLRYEEPDDPSISLTILKPVTFDFIFEHNPACTGLPFKAEVKSIHGNVCEKAVKYSWEFERNGRYEGKVVQVKPYTIADSYKVTLTASVENYTCATTVAAPKFLEVINRAIADFSTDASEYCILGENIPEIKMTDHSAGDQVDVLWSVNGNEEKTGQTDWNYRPEDPGIYQIKQHAYNSCSDSLLVKEVKVKQDPDIEWFRLPDTLCAENFQVTSEQVRYTWNGNEAMAHWKIISPSGAIVLIDELWPVVSFTESGKYTVSVHVDGVGCGGTLLDAIPEEVVIVSNDILVDVRPGKAPVNDTIFLCDGNTLKFDNHSQGENLVHQWEIIPTGLYGGNLEVTCTEGHSLTSASPEFKFNGYGDCILRDHIRIKQGCNQDQAEFKIHVGKAPTIAIFDFGRDTLICKESTINMLHKVYCDWYNNPPQYTWTFDPDDLIGDKTQLYPEVTFPNAGFYTLKLELTERGCSDAQTNSEHSIRVRVRENKIKAELSQVPETGLFCEGSQLLFRNKATDIEGDIQCTWQILKKDGWQKVPEGPQPILPYTFDEYGDYQVIGKATGYCDADTDTLELTIHKNPRVELKDTSICPGLLQLKDFVTYEWYNNADHQVHWSVDGPVNGYTGDLNTLTPELQLQQPGNFTIRVELSHPGCTEGLETTRVERVYHVYDTAIYNGVNLIGVGTVADPNRVCEGETVTFENETGAERQVSWNWKVESSIEGGYSFADGGTTSVLQNPQLSFSKAGDYQVRLLVDEGCNSREFVFPVNVEGIPQVLISNIDSMCEPYTFTSDLVEIPNTDDLRKARWRITPATGFDAFDSTSLTPAICFHAGLYEVKALFWNRCTEPGSKTFTVNIDKFIEIGELRDTAVCVLGEPFLLQAQPDTGIWSSSADNLIIQGEKTYFDPHFDPYLEDDVKVVYRLYNRSCVDSAKINVHIRPLPHVEAGKPLGMCLNEAPRLLIGRDSVLGGVWQENREGAYWELNGVKLPDFQFDIAGLPEENQKADDFRLIYHVEDGFGCTNIDSTTMTIHPLPKTDFEVAPQNCIYRDVLFVPMDTVGNTFEWTFGDDTEQGLSRDTMAHSYTADGWKEVVCIALSKYGCRDTSDSRKIEIVNLPPQPFFAVDTLNGCAPLEIQITIDTADYADNHNYLSFHWDYGEGTEEEGLGDSLRIKGYPSGAWDTTYVTSFTVMNMCDTLRYDTTITVFSVPQVALALVHRWECAPIDLEVQNTTTGNNCKFSWVITNNRNQDTIRDLPQERNLYYTFDTDSASTTYAIHLRAVNVCNEDDSTALLTVKPRQIRAHFTPLEDAYACVGEEIFFRNNSTDTVASILTTKWQFGDGAVDSTWSPAHAYDAPGTYPVSLWIHNGCGWRADTVPVNIYPLPKLTIEYPAERCEADTFTFVLHSDQELSSILWRFGDGVISHQDSVKHAYAQAGDFGVTVVGVAANLHACTDSLTQQMVVVYPSPDVTILPLDTFQCTPLYYVPEVEGNAFLLWDYGDGSAPDSEGIHWYENESDSVQHFTVKIHAETDKQCQREYERRVTVFNRPKAALELKVEKGNPQKVTFVNLSKEYTNCIWQLPHKGAVQSLEDQVVGLPEGEYEASVMVENLYHCWDTASIEHKVLIKGLYFPNTFIPHSLNGKVNQFNGIGLGLTRYKLEIFDQYHNKIWETRALENGKPSEGWDGCNLKGENMPQGIYIWRAEAIFADDEVWTGKNNESGVPETTQGSVLLLRE